MNSQMIFTASNAAEAESIRTDAAVIKSEPSGGRGRLGVGDSELGDWMVELFTGF